MKTDLRERRFAAEAPGRLRQEGIAAEAAVSTVRRAARPMPRRRVWTLGLVGLALGILYALNFSALRAVAGSDGKALFRFYPVLFGVAFLLYLVGVWLCWEGGRRVAWAVIASGIVFRLFMVPTDVVLSSDLYRYLWDGRVQTAGINPFRYAPRDDALAVLRDPEIHPQINRPGARTIYPPGAQLLFAGLAWAAPSSIGALRLLLIGCDLATMLLFVRLLARLEIPEGRVAVYAWAPLAVFEVVQAAHIDGAVLPFVLGALLACMAGRAGLAGILLGGASLIKLYPAILVPALWKPRTWRLLLALLATVGLGYLPYAWGIGGKVTGFLPTYFDRHEDFNVGLRYFVTEGLGLEGELARKAAMGVLLVVLALVLVAIGRRRPETPLGLAQGAGLAVGAYLLLVPTTMHPWYVVWLIPFLAVLPGAGWWYLSGAFVLSYLKYAAAAEILPLWARCLEWLPAYGLVLLGLLTYERWPLGARPAILRPKASS